MTTQWEYKVLKFEWGWKGFDYGEIESELTELGQQGWEAIDTIAPGIASGAPTEIVVILKRINA